MLSGVQPPEMHGRFGLEATIHFTNVIEQFFALPETHRHVLDSIEMRDKEGMIGGSQRKRVTFDLARVRDFDEDLFYFIVGAPLEAIPLFV